MPSGEHESPIALANLEPGLLTWLLANLFGVKVPDYHHARPHPTDVRDIVPHTYHADGMLLFCDAADRGVLAVVFEVQRSPKRRKRRMWKLYVAQLERELDVDAALIVYCSTHAIARYYRRMFEFEGLSLSLRPFVFASDDVPLVLDPELARANPAVAVFAAICHGGRAEVDAAFPALAAALEAIGPASAVSYYDIVLAGLPPEPRKRWEAFVTTVAKPQYYSELFRELSARSEARGEARAVLAVLDARGIDVPETMRGQVLACTDVEQLEAWVRRAATATSADEVVHA
jgi:hypothetical protein